MDWGGLLLGAALALIVALAVWWIELRVAVPRLEFGVMRLRPKVSRVIRLDMRPHLWRDASPRLLAVAKIDPNADELIALEALLSATPEVYLRVGVLANDEVSGTRSTSPRSDTTLVISALAVSADWQ
jgi:hypothetical protein